MEPTNDDFWTKIARYVRESLADNEAPSFLNDQSDDPDRKAAWEQAQNLWKQSRLPEPDYRPDVERGWERFQFLRDSEASHYRRLPSEEVVPMRPSWWKYAGIAASVVLAVGLSYLLLGSWWSGAEEVRLVATDQKEMYYLPDSSQVWLNQYSELRYATDFDRDHRVVHLEGEAFFEVRKAEGRRFTVYSGPAKTEVIGTSFNVRAYSDDSVAVHVVSGKVAFSPRDEDNAVFLTPGQTALIQAEQTVAERSTIRDPNFRAWQNNQLVFDNTRLTRISQQLEEYYGVTVELANPALTNCRYTASFNEASLEEVLNVLVAVGDLKYEKTGRRVILSGTGCP